MATFGDIETKADLVGCLTSLRSAAIYDIFAQISLQCFAKDCMEGRADPELLVTELPEGRLTFAAFINGLDQIGPEAAKETKRNANRAVTRNAMKEAFRLTQAYCEASSQEGDLKSQPWYQFARILVNSLSHSFRLDFRQHDLKKLPVMYESEILDSTMNGKSVSMPLSILVKLLDDIVRFVSNDLSR